jgi:hypothetical protein
VSFFNFMNANVHLSTHCTLYAFYSRYRVASDHWSLLTDHCSLINDNAYHYCALTRHCTHTSQVSRAPLLGGVRAGELGGGG